MAKQCSPSKLLRLFSSKHVMKTLTQEKPKDLKNNTAQISHTVKQEPENTKMKKLNRFVSLLLDLALITQGTVLFKIHQLLAVGIIIFEQGHTSCEAKYLIVVQYGWSTI